MSELDSSNIDLFSKYELGMHRYATRPAEAIECQHKDTGEKELIWLLRSPLSDAKLEQIFKARLQNLLSLDLPLPTVRTFGVANGNPYLLMEYLGGTKLTSFNGSLTEKISLFSQAIKVVAGSHKNGIFFSDLCDDSFIIRPKGGLSLVSLMGPFEGKNPKNAPPSSVFYFLSPEQRNGVSPSLPTDVFALGIIGYKLFTGSYPVSKPQSHQLGPKDDLLSGAPTPSSVNNNLPDWIDNFLGRCLGLKFADRFETAEEVLQAYEQGTTTGILKLEGRWTSTAVAVRATTTGVSVASKNATEQQGTDSTTSVEEGDKSSQDYIKQVNKVPRTGGKKSKYLIFACVGLMVGALTAGVLSIGKRDNSSKKVQIEYVDLLPPDLQESVKTILDNSGQPSQVSEAIEKVRDSDNPATFSVLSSLAKFPGLRAVRGEIISAISTKLKDSGLSRSGELIKEWSSRILSEGKDPADYPSFANFLRSSDLTLPLASRRDAIHRTSIEDRTSALELAAALSLDDPDSEHFLPVLRQLIVSDANSKQGKAGNLSEAEYKELSELGLGALMAQNRVLNTYFERDLSSMLGSVSNKDLASMLRSFAQTENNLVYEAANEALKRGAISGLSTIPMKALVEADRLTMSKATKLALIDFSVGVFNSFDVGAISTWTSLQFEPVLLAVCALSKDREVALEAFEVLAGRNIDLEPSRSLMRWFRNPVIWKNKKDLVMPLGVLGLHKIATDTEISTALDTLMPYAGSGRLFEIFIELGDPRIIRMLLERVAPITSSPLLLGLTKHADKNVRISAVKALQGRNEVQVLQDLVRGYESERDPDVKRAYQENHWVVKNRE